MEKTSTDILSYVQTFYEEQGDYVPNLLDVACSEAITAEQDLLEIQEREEFAREEFMKKSLARIQKARDNVLITKKQRDSVLAIAGVTFPVKEVPVPAPTEAEQPDNASEVSGDEKGRWIQPGTVYKVSNFISTRINEIAAGTRTSPTPSVHWKSGKYNPHSPQMNEAITFWQANGPMNSTVARERWMIAGGRWEKGGLRGSMCELIKQQILVPV
jgi:hypothetical protein